MNPLSWADLRNLDLASKLGCLDAEGLAAMRRGNAPTVRHGPYTGDKLSVDHIIPRAVCPELDNVIANLELMPLRMNESKNDKIGARQLDLAKKLHAAGLLSAEGKQKIDNHPPGRGAWRGNPPTSWRRTVGWVEGRTLEHGVHAWLLSRPS